MKKSIVSLALLLSCSSLTPVPLRASPARSETEPPLAHAVDAYLKGHYEEALPDLEKARDGGTATGAQLYMLGFCLATVRNDQDASNKAYADAKTKLEHEVAAPKPSLESFFYLANYYQNQRDADASKKAAESGVAAIESKRTQVGKDGVSLFRAGKLYADAGKAEPSIAYHRRAIAAFAKDPSPPPEYLKRSLESVARVDLTKGDPEKTADLWEKLLTLNPGTQDGNWKLGIALLRASRFEKAHDIFERARQQGGEQGQEAFYAASLATNGKELVATGVKIPTKDKDGKLIASLDDAALDQRTKDWGAKASQALNREPKQGEYEVVTTKLGRKAIAPGPKLVSELADARSHIIAFAIEQLARGNSLQSKAFEGGYAPLIIQNWTQLWKSAHQELQQKVQPVADQTKAD